MRVLCVDDERFALDVVMDICRGIDEITELNGFTDPMEALAFAEKNGVEVALLDIDMFEMSGLELAKKLKQVNKYVNVIFCTGYSEFSLEAIQQDCSGYLLKPIGREDIIHQLNILRFCIDKQKKIRIRCFGNFEVFIDGRPAIFKYEKTRELLAYLIDRNGAMVTLGEISSYLWEDEGHSEYLKSLRKDLIAVFKENGLDHLIQKPRGRLGIIKNGLSCDYFDFLDGKPEGLNAYHGEYMRQYSWAETTNGSLLD